MGILSRSLDEFKQPSMFERSNEFWKQPSYWNLLMVLPWILGLVVLIWQWNTYSRAADRQAVTTAQILSVEKNKWVHYQFTYANHIYNNMQPQFYKNGVPLPGEKVTIYYDPEAPTVNSMTDLHQESMNAFGPVPFLVIAIPTTVFFILRRIRATRNS